MSAPKVGESGGMCDPSGITHNSTAPPTGQPAYSVTVDSSKNVRRPSPVRVLHYVQMFLTTLAIVVSMEAVGVILVAGLLVIPASTAWLFSTRLRHILWLSALLGMGAALLGNFTAFVVTPKGGGSILVLCAGLMFAGAFLFSPGGLARRAWRWLQHGRRIHREDTLKAIYRLLETRDFSPAELHAGEAGCTPRDLRTLLRHGLGSGSTQSFTLTPAGFREAARMVRNHRLWELYLTQRAGYAQDHVHDSAEQMEHLLAEENIAHMMEVLGHPQTDPHGKRIPSPGDCSGGFQPPTSTTNGRQDGSTAKDA